MRTVNPHSRFTTNAIWDYGIDSYPDVTPNPLIDYFSYIAILQTYDIVYFPNVLRIEKLVDHNRNFDYGAYWIWLDIQHAAAAFHISIAFLL